MSSYEYKGRMEQLRLFELHEQRATPWSLLDHMASCNVVGCLRCAGGNLPHFGRIVGEDDGRA